MMFEVMDIKKSFEAADLNHDKSISASGRIPSPYSFLTHLLISLYFLIQKC